MTCNRRVLARGGALLVIGALTLWFAHGVNWRAAAASVRGADPSLLALALVANLASLSLKGVRWWVFLRRAGVRSLSLVLRATYAGAALNNLVVAQGGDGARVLAVSRGARIPAAHALAALAVERVLDGGCYLALLVGATWLLPLPPALERWGPVAALLLLLLAIALGALTVVRPRTIDGPARGVFGFARRFAAGATDLASPASVGVAVLLSAAAWALQVGCYHLTARAAHLAVPLTASVASMLAVGVGFLVRATPGNVGVFQVVYALAMRSFGVAEGPAVGAAVLIQAVQVLPVLLLGALSAPGLMTRNDTGT
jgi:uncharacterized membrane protein YbhN (UPF0104 family)